MRLLFAVLMAGICAGCAVVRPKYVPETDVQKHNLRGDILRTESRYLNLDGRSADDPGRPTEFDILIVSEYNPQGNIVSEETYGDGGQRLTKRDVYVYDTTGTRLLSSEYHDLLNNKVTWILYKYDSRGRLDTYHPVAGEWTAGYRYGRRGYPSSVTTVAADTVNSRKVFTYDRKGRLKTDAYGNYVTRYEYHPNGSLRSSTNRSQVELYDRNGDMVKTVIYITSRGEDGEAVVEEGITEAFYEYDDRGNWTVRRLVSDGETYGAWVRVIEYRD
ncbi:MAG: hypothetical protein LUE26_07680 [Alistipes sp.]|nr:hypothetical protein [Alistipes sp.]